MNNKILSVFDGHNDLLTRLWLSEHPDPIAEFILGRPNGHLDLPRCHASGFQGGLFALFVPPFQYVKTHHPNKLHHPDADDFTQLEIEQICLEQLNIAKSLLQRCPELILCRTVEEIRHARSEQKIAIVLHMEGAEALQLSQAQLSYFYQEGLRSVGPLWNRPSQLGHGLEFNFPYQPHYPQHLGRGLTLQGKQFIKKCTEMNIAIDVSHMNEDAFWDTYELIQRPFIATHSNAHQLCPQVRNLTDEQLRAIRNRDGMVGINFDVAFLRADGKRNSDTSISVILDHIEYLVDHLGETRVGFGSDFDGCLLSQDMKDVTGLIKIIEQMQCRNYSDKFIQQICSENWLAVLKRIWLN